MVHTDFCENFRFAVLPMQYPIISLYSILNSTFLALAKQGHLRVFYI